MYSRDYYYNYLTPRESAPPRERATHRLAFRNMSESEWPALFVQYFDGQEWAKQATSDFYRDNQVTMIFRVAHDEQTGTFRLLESSRVSYRSPDERGWLGVMLTENEGGGGAVVHQVEDGSPAQEAGFEQGDILLTLADKSIASPSQAKLPLKPYETRHRGCVRARAQWGPNGEDGTVGNPTRTPPPQMRTGR